MRTAVIDAIRIVITDMPFGPAREELQQLVNDPNVSLETLLRRMDELRPR